MPKECPICGATALNEMHGEYRLTPPPNVPGGDFVVLDSTWETCKACGEDILTTELESRLDKIRYKRLGLLMPHEIRSIRERAGLSQTAMAEFIGVGEKTYTRWESGGSLQNKSSDNLIRLSDQFPELFSFIEAQRQPDRWDQIRKYVESLSTLKGNNDYALAAHGAELDLRLAEELRNRLRMLARDRCTNS